jgi:hypothetical protein
MDGRQHQLKRKILALRILAFAIVIPLGVFMSVFKTVYPHNRDQGPIAIVVVAIALGVVIPIAHRISRIKAELPSLN